MPFEVVVDDDGPADVMLVSTLIFRVGIDRESSFGLRLALEVAAVELSIAELTGSNGLRRTKL